VTDEQNTLSKEEFWEALIMPSHAQRDCGNCIHALYYKPFGGWHRCGRCTRSVPGPSPFYSGYEIGDMWEWNEK